MSLVLCMWRPISIYLEFGWKFGWRFNVGWKFKFGWLMDKSWMSNPKKGCHQLTNGINILTISIGGCIRGSFREYAKTYHKVQRSIAKGNNNRMPHASADRCQDGIYFCTFALPNLLFSLLLNLWSCIFGHFFLWQCQKLSPSVAWPFKFCIYTLYFIFFNMVRSYAFYEYIVKPYMISLKNNNQYNIYGKVWTKFDKHNKIY